MSSSSSRLRSRLARDELDAAQISTVTENFVLVGTPLPSLDKRDPNEGKPVWEQEVRDDQGRRRFHGAFTGGWSAGYYNTVGSKEGWTPETFVSSRSARSGQRSQPRPEDYMDEEDLAEMDSGRKVSQRDGYSTEARLDNRHADDEVLGDLLGLGQAAKKQIIAGVGRPLDTGLVAPKSSLGYRILTRMGWKPGSGLGRPSQPGQQNVDTPMPAIVHGVNKKDSHGLGWIETMGKAIDKSSMVSSGALATGRGESGQLSRGFDISVLEEADADDLGDIYEKSESIQDVIKRRKEQQFVAVRSKETPLPQNPTSSPGQLSNEGRRTWYDGKPLPPGFIIEEGSVIDGRAEQKQEDWFPPPIVPPGWKPDPLKIWSEAKGPVGPPPPTSKSARPPTPTQHIRSAERGHLLGEARIPGPPPNLASYLPKASLESTAETQTPASIKVPTLEATTARAALKGFLPFGNDVEKQRRYVSYLEYQSDPASSQKGKMPVPAGQTVAQFSQEVEEFARSASIFKPLSSTMASRFASASTVEGSNDAHVSVGGLYQPSFRSKESLEEEAKRKSRDEEARLKREKEENMNDRQRAAKAGMFGHLTRQAKAWYPPRLLCKRFGVPDPHPERTRDSIQDESDEMRSNLPSGGTRDPFYGSTGVGGGREDRLARSEARRELKRGEARWEKSKRELLGLVGDRPWENPGGQPISTDLLQSNDGDDSPGEKVAQNSLVARPFDLEQVGLGEDEEVLKEIDSFVKPSKEVFKSIFASDEEDDRIENKEGRTDKSIGEEAASITKEGVGASSSLSMQGSGELSTSPSSTTTAPTGPVFIPRNKRNPDVSATTNIPGSVSSSKNAKKRKKDSSAKKIGGGALTFSFDDDDDDDDDGDIGDGGHRNRDANHKEEALKTTSKKKQKKKDSLEPEMEKGKTSSTKEMDRQGGVSRSSSSPSREVEDLSKGITSTSTSTSTSAATATSPCIESESSSYPSKKGGGQIHSHTHIHTRMKASDLF